MARFVTVNVQCDWSTCDVIAEEGIGEVVEKTLTIDKGAPKAFLLCKKHLEDFELTVLPLMAAGIKVETGKRSKTPAAGAGAAPSAVTSSVGNGHKSELFECRDPSCDRTLKNRTGLAQHVIRQHGFEDLAAYEAAYPDSTID